MFYNMENVRTLSYYYLNRPHVAESKQELTCDALWCRVCAQHSTQTLFYAEGTGIVLIYQQLELQSSEMCV